MFPIVFADIDGTLVGSDGIMSPRTFLALRKVQAGGRILVLCTGRGRHAAQKIADQLGVPGYGIVLNGALVLRWDTGEILRRSLLPIHAVRAACDTAHGLGLAPIWLGSEETNDSVYAEHATTIWPAYEARNGSRIRYVDNLASISVAPASLAAYGPEEDAVRLAQAWSGTLGPEVAAVAGPTAIYDAWYAQLTGAEADKGRAAAFLADHLAVSREDTLAIGDHENDVGLLRWAGIGVCMGDGHPVARAAADFITGTVAEDGAAAALERFVLNCDNE